MKTIVIEGVVVGEEKTISGEYEEKCYPGMPYRGGKFSGLGQYQQPDFKGKLGCKSDWKPSTDNQGPVPGDC